MVAGDRLTGDDRAFCIDLSNSAEYKLEQRELHGPVETRVESYRREVAKTLNNWAFIPPG